MGAIIYLLQKVCKVPTQSLRNLIFVKLQVFGWHFYWKNPEGTFPTSWNYQTFLQNSLDLVFLGSTHASKLIVAIELDSPSRTYFLRFLKNYYENIFNSIYCCLRLKNWRCKPKRLKEISTEAMLSSQKFFYYVFQRRSFNKSSNYNNSEWEPKCSDTRFTTLSGYLRSH